ncbi:MAG: hypothetical protein FWE24_10840 [Defluviitaleaceae bacterium]|nr:hypothetical protein [Defluviitaleaceae bacterium]
MKTLITFIFLTIILLSGFAPLYTSALAMPEVEGRSLILMEQSTGTVLFDVNPGVRIFPASTTKILTAIVMREHIGPEEIILIGPEVNMTPPGSSRAFLSEGSYISGINLLRGIIVTSGNDTSNVIAAEVARRVSGNAYMLFDEAERIFVDLMNEKARELGAYNSNFMNAHGFHHEQHFSTAMDMAVIARAALSDPLLRQIFAESYYEGPGVTGEIPEGMRVSNYNWTTGNMLLVEDNAHFFPYATGMRTGFHNHANHALVSSASKDGFDLIAAAFQSRIDVRFRDSIAMFNFGFDNFGFTQIQRDGTVIDNIAFHNPMLGEITHMDVKVVGDYTQILQIREFDRVIPTINYRMSLFHTPTEEELEGEGDDPDPGPRLILPVEEGDVLGEIIYTLNGAEIFRADIVATMTAMPRTMETDFYFYRGRFFEFIGSRGAIPIWIGAGIVFLLILRWILRLIRRKKRRKMFDNRKGDKRLHYRYRRY